MSLRNLSYSLIVVLLFLNLFGMSGCQKGVLASQSSGPSTTTIAEIYKFPATATRTAIREEIQSIPENAPDSATTTAQSNAAPVYFTPTPGVTSFPEVSLKPEICSPLEDHNLDELYEIITFPYDPPPPGKDTGHHGVDFAYYRLGERLSIKGVPIQSVLAGLVAAVNENLIPYGNMVIVETPFDQLPLSVVKALDISDQQSLYLLYAHMEATPQVQAGVPVTCGQTLGRVGNTPENWSSAPHLHFEARKGPAGYDFSGMRFYDPYAKIVDMEKYTLWRTSGEYVLIDPMVLLDLGFSTGTYQDH